MKKLLVLIAILFLAVPALATSESITVADTAIGINSAYLPTTLSGCWGWHMQKGFCTLETAQIRYWPDGTTPTSTEGHLANTGTVLYFQSCQELFGFKAIRTGGTSGVLRCTYW